MRGSYPNGTAIPDIQAGSFPEGPARALWGMRYQKREKGKKKENGSKKQKHKPGSATQEPEDLCPQPGNPDNQKSHDDSVILGTAWGLGLKASHCSELGFVWWLGTISWAIFSFKIRIERAGSIKRHWYITTIFKDPFSPDQSRTTFMEDLYAYYALWHLLGRRGWTRLTMRQSTPTILIGTTSCLDQVACYFVNMI